MTTNLTVSATFTKNNGQPATGLTLSDIKLFLTSQNKSTGADTTVWDGTQVATVEINNVGTYTRILATADLTANDYFAMAQYTGATVLDSSYAYGQVSMAEADVLQIEETDATNQIRDAILTDATRFAGANIDAAISSRSTLTAAQVWASGTRTLTSFGTLAADVVTALFASTLFARSFQNLILDIWAQVVGKFAANDATAPTSITYKAPDDTTTQLTHTVGATTRDRS
jgi:hypothetical protein